MTPILLKHTQHRFTVNPSVGTTNPSPLPPLPAGGLSTTAMVKVQVGDVNDNQPAFYPRRYNVSLRESQSRAAPVVVVAATDRDSGANGRVRYAIVRGNEQGLFRIDPATGEVRTRERGRTGRSEDWGRDVVCR